MLLNHHKQADTLYAIYFLPQFFKCQTNKTAGTKLPFGDHRHSFWSRVSPPQPVPSINTAHSVPQGRVQEVERMHPLTGARPSYSLAQILNKGGSNALVLVLSGNRLPIPTTGQV